MAQAAIEASGLKFTPVDDIAKIVADRRATFLTGKTRSVEYRKNQLKQLVFMLQDNEEAFVESLKKDLGRARFESVFAEIVGTINETLDTIHNLDSWAKTKSAYAGLTWLFHSPTIRKEPKGTVLVIGAWNYPISVAIGPVIGAIAAGCTVILKPSEVSPHTAKLITELFPKYLDPASYSIVNGAIPETTALLDQRFEHIFYTGNGTVGRIVAEKAAKWLCPVSLELGGKSPVYVDASADLKTTAHRLLWGKSLNCGQTCIAPDYILVERSVQDKLVEEFKKAAAEFWPQKTGGVSKSESYGRIVNEGHWQRLSNIVGETKGTIVLGDSGDQSNKLLPPTIIKNVKADDASMQSELFGPILPLVPVQNVREAVKFVNERDQPLALYCFSGDKAKTKYFFDNTRSGAVVSGDVLLHFAVPTLPFGGTGPSGYGNYHGKANFDTYTHERASLEAPHKGIMGTIVEAIMAMRYPPYTTANLNQFRMAMAQKPRFSRPVNPHTSRSVVASGPLKKISLLIALVAVILGVRNRDVLIYTLRQIF